MTKNTLKLDLELDVDSILTSEEYGTTLREELIDLVKHEIRQHVRKAAAANMKKFVSDYLGGTLRTERDAKGREVVLIPLLTEELR